MRCDGSIRVDPSTRHETLNVMTQEFPYQADLCDLHDFPGNQFPWHWHRAVEIFYIRSGRLVYHLPHGEVCFEAGQGGFLNSNVLHMTTCRESDACEQEEQQFLPEFIGGLETSRIMEKYVQPVLHAPGLTLIKFDPAHAAHTPMLDAICRAYRLYEQQPDGFELELQQTLLSFWQGLYQLTRGQHPPERANPDDQRIKQMLRYIAAHYAGHLRLEDIAAAAYLSPRACGRCFQSQLGTTPFAYLLDYRVQRACEQLAMTDLPVGEVALQCGFSSSSYFGRVFFEKTGKTPNAYRQEKKQH